MSENRFELAIVCGGPSLERGISLNSARSLLDHIEGVIAFIYYVAPDYRMYKIDASQVYSNTPEDFDFKLSTVANYLPEEEWIECLKSHDMVFPVIHGKYGEDGVLAEKLTKHGIPYIGSSAKSCENMFHKGRAATALNKAGYPVLDSCKATPENCEYFLEKHGRIVIKPSAGGSSIGVHVVKNKGDIKNALSAVKALDSDPICEAYCEGKEFTVVVLESPTGPVSLIPTEVQIQTEGEIFDYRRKYLPSSNTRWYCPAQFSNRIIERIRQQAEDVFHLFSMSDFVRIDGWLKDNKVIFSDINPVSGMEQNSFIFLQASRIGMKHSDLVHYILSSACRRYGIKEPVRLQEKVGKTCLPILMGGDTVERQISLMSATNVWLKLQQSEKIDAAPYFVDKEQMFWPLAYTHALNHTTEEVYDNLVQSSMVQRKMRLWLGNVRENLGLPCINSNTIYPKTEPLTLHQFCKMYQDGKVFIGLHGGFGEDGTLQDMLDQYNISYNGSGTIASQLGMDKYAFAEKVNCLSVSGIRSLEKIQISKKTTWEELLNLGERIVLKPRSLGCSEGVEVICDKHQYDEWMANYKEGYIAERYIKTDDFTVTDGHLEHHHHSGYIELTMTVWQKGQELTGLMPSITVARGAVLSIEEKFQGGTGMNITPPPKTVIDSKKVVDSQVRLAKMAALLGVRHYARIDYFHHIITNEIIVIEINSLPALTPSTVLYHQLMATGICNTPKEGVALLASMEEHEKMTL